MASEISVELKGEGLDNLRKLLSEAPKKIRKEASYAINNTAKWSLKETGKEIRTVVAISTKGVKRSLKLGKKAQPTNLGTTVTVIKTKRPSIKEYGARDNKKTGVSYRIKKGGKRGFIRSAFSVQKINKHIFKRKGKARFPIVKIKGPSPWGVYKRHKLLEWSKDEIQERLHYELNRRARAVMRRMMK